MSDIFGVVLHENVCFLVRCRKVTSEGFLHHTLLSFHAEYLLFTFVYICSVCFLNFY